MNRLILYLLETELGRRVELQMLMNLVASSLGLLGKCVLMTSSERTLELFARQTAMHLSECSEAQHAMLGRKAFRMGKFLRNSLTDRSEEALMKVVVQLYRNIGIEMRGTFPGKVSVVRCYFCKHYNSRICAVASTIDSGIISGLYNAGLLCFTQRITEGENECQCHLNPLNN